MTLVQYHYPPMWEEGVLVGLRAPLTPENKRFLTAWGTAEGGFAKWNPLNTTFPELPGCTAYNTITTESGIKIHVWNYPRPAWGTAATVIGLTSPASGILTFGPIVGHLQDGSYTAEEIVQSCWTPIDLWGTNPQAMLDVLKDLP